MKRVFLILVIVTLFLCTVNPPKTFAYSAKSYVLMDGLSKEVILEQNCNMRLKNASTTKIMTALLAYEAVAQHNDIVTINKEMYAEGSSMYLKEGDKVKLSDLASGMLACSGNDAANAIALHLGESFENFAVMMNERAQQIGMSNTNFVTAGGLDDKEHYSTAYDMALLMIEAMENTYFSKAQKQNAVTVDFVYPANKQETYYNHNKLLNLYDYCIGGKTGYTKAAGRCLVTVSQLNSARLVAVTLNAADDWNDHIKLYNYGFSLYKEHSLAPTKGLSLSVAGSKGDKAEVAEKTTAVVFVKKQDIEKIEKKIYLPSFVFSPIRKGQKAGVIKYILYGKEIAETELVLLRSFS